MSKLVTVKCNRCGETKTSNFNVLKFVAGELSVQNDENLDLCQSCTSDFRDWLKSIKFELMASEAPATE
jgi:hypothetical protein